MVIIVSLRLFVYLVTYLIVESLNDVIVHRNDDALQLKNLTSFDRNFSFQINVQAFTSSFLFSFLICSISKVFFSYSTYFRAYSLSPLSRSQTTIFFKNLNVPPPQLFRFLSFSPSGLSICSLICTKTVCTYFPSPGTLL